MRNQPAGFDGHTRRIKLDVGDTRHCQRIGNVAPLLVSR
jgi:hypothetical protein